MLYPTDTSEVSELSDALCGKSVFGLLTDLANSMKALVVKTENETPLVKNCIYDLGEQASLTLTLPKEAQIGDYIQVDFISPEEATALSVTGEDGTPVIGDIPTPEANKLYSLYCEWGRVNASEYGWRVSYKEYPV